MDSLQVYVASIIGIYSARWDAVLGTILIDILGGWCDSRQSICWCIYITTSDLDLHSKNTNSGVDLMHALFVVS